ncbi:RDD family protein [Solimonas soli]|uniref:RDD family protein n=1 Tax=Solimonas soli TaxID=413479 RepID=UPI0004B41469|nr:RDD family protein [Solimonas soli]
MSEPLPPAPLWRRLIAAVYDGLLLLGLWMATVLIDAVLRNLAGIPYDWATLQLCVFLVWLGFFGWFWTHGGQTLGMRVWRLRVQRDDGRALSWAAAATRCAVMLAVWGVVLAPALARLPHLRDGAHAGIVALVCALLAALMLIGLYADRRRRAPQDWLSGTTIVELPKPPKT